MSGRAAGVLELCSSQSDMSLFICSESIAPIGRTLFEKGTENGC